MVHELAAARLLQPKEVMLVTLGDVVVGEAMFNAGAEPVLVTVKTRGVPELFPVVVDNPVTLKAREDGETESVVASGSGSGSSSSAIVEQLTLIFVISESTTVPLPSEIVQI